MIKLNFGCGTNRLPSWQNFDVELDIAKPLPFPDGSADAILAEHVVEHIGYYEALAFFGECRRVLRPCGVARIAVPSVENLLLSADQDYCDFVHKRGWAPTPDLTGALHAMLYKHGHKAAWTQSVLRASLLVSGFAHVEDCEPGQSRHPHLCGVEGHGKVIGEHFNAIETVVCEGA